MNATYRRKRWLISLGLLATLFGVGFAVAGTCLLGVEPNPGSPPWAMAVMAIAVVGSTLLCGIGGPWTIAEVIRHRLTIDGDNVTQVQIFRTKEVNLARVVEAQWRISQGGGRLVLKTADEELRLDFSGYSRSETRQLIKFLHLRLPAAVQKGWEKYWSYAWPMFDVPDPTRREESAEETRRLRRRLVIWLLLGVSLTIVGTILLWVYTGDVKSLKGLAFLVFLLPILLLCFVVSAGGKVAAHPDVRRGFNPSPLVFIGLAVLILSFLAAIPFAFLDMRTVCQFILIGGPVFACLLMLIGLQSRGRRIRETRSLAAKLAEQEYMQPKAKGGGQARPR